MPRQTAAKQLPVEFDPIRKQLFVENLSLRLSPVDAAVAAGFTSNLKAVARKLLEDEDVLDMIEAVRRAREQHYDVSKDKVLEDLVDAKEMSRTQSDPKSMVMALKEISEVMGHHAPRVTTVDATHRTAGSGPQALRQIPDAELLEMAEEGSFTVLELEDKGE